MRITLAAALAVALASPAVAEEAGFSEKSKALLQAAIVREGYNCPTVRRVTSEGADANGDVLKVSCRVEGAGMTNRVYYRVTLATNDTMLVEPVE
jgi:flagellar biosynthesis component FlhA